MNIFKFFKLAMKAEAVSELPRLKSLSEIVLNTQLDKDTRFAAAIESAIIWQRLNI